MRKMLMAAAAAGLLALGAPAFGQNAPAGTSEGHDVPVVDDNGQPTGETEHIEDNQVNCGDGADALADSGAGVQVRGEQEGSGGALVVCNDGDAAPVQGRVIAAGGTEGGWVAIDGDGDNAEEGQGWARVDLGTEPGVTCGDVEADETDSADSPGEQDNCG